MAGFIGLLPVLVHINRISCCHKMPRGSGEIIRSFREFQYFILTLVVIFHPVCLFTDLKVNILCIDKRQNCRDNRQSTKNKGRHPQTDF